MRIIRLDAEEKLLIIVIRLIRWRQESDKAETSRELSEESDNFVPRLSLRSLRYTSTIGVHFMLN